MRITLAIITAAIVCMSMSALAGLIVSSTGNDAKLNCITGFDAGSLGIVNLNPG